jgi:hypothetical protein
MGVLKSRFTEISANAGKPAKGEIQVSTSLPAILNIYPAPLGSAKDKKDILIMEFDYEVSYKPIDGKISLKGELMYLDENTKKILDKWKKDKQVESSVSVPILNYLLRVCAVESVKISDSLQMPVPIQLPEIRPKESK